MMGHHNPPALPMKDAMTTHLAKPRSTKVFYLRWVVCVILAVGQVTILTLQIKTLPEKSILGSFFQGTSNTSLGSTLLTCLFFFVAITVLTPLAGLAVIGLQTLDLGFKASSSPWTRPTFHDFPWQMQNPLILMHFVAQFMMVCGSVMTVSSLWNGLPFLGLGLMGIWFSVMLFVGLRLCEKAYPKRMAKTDVE